MDGFLPLFFESPIQFPSTSSPLAFTTLASPPRAALCWLPPWGAQSWIISSEFCAHLSARLIDDVLSAAFKQLRRKGFGSQGTMRGGAKTSTTALLQISGEAWPSF
jgi:hypothetical protein